MSEREEQKLGAADSGIKCNLVLKVFSMWFVVFFVMLASGGCTVTPEPKPSELEILALKSKCREDGMKVSKEWEQRYFGNTFPSDQLYSYNQAFHTCLWLVEYVHIGRLGADLKPVDDSHKLLILDIYSNRILSEFTRHNGVVVGDVSEADFNRLKGQLFK